VQHTGVYQEDVICTSASFVYAGLECWCFTFCWKDQAA